MFANPVDPACPRGIPQNHLIVKQENLGLKNAVIILDIDEHSDPVDQRAALVSDNCTLTPRVQTVLVGTSITITSRGGAEHLIHAYLDGDTAFSVDIAGPEASVRRPLLGRGFYKIDCDKHLWERAWIYVADNRYTAVSDAGGYFTLADVPPGRYTLRAWHEGWTEKGKGPDGRMEYQPETEIQRVTVKSKRTTEVQFNNLQPSD